MDHPGLDHAWLDHPGLDHPWLDHPWLDHAWLDRPWMPPLAGALHDGPLLDGPPHRTSHTWIGRDRDARMNNPPGISHAARTRGRAS